MRAIRNSGLAVGKIFLVLLLAMLAFQSAGINGLAAPAASLPHLQSGTPTPMPLTCGSSATTPTYCNIQIVLMIDDSGSMRTNDPGGLRNQGAINLVNILADQYYSAAQTLKEDNESFRLPDVRVAVIHFSRGVKRNSGWIPIDPNNLDQWKNDLNTEINWPPRGTKEYSDFYARKQYTSFSEAFGFARRLLSSSGVQGVAGDCTRRSILLFTDGTPENERGILTGDDLKQEMDAVENTTTSLQAALPADSKVSIYITGFKIDSKYWTQVKGRWDTIAMPPETSDTSTPQTPEEGNTLGRVQLVGDASELPVRMEAITASLIDVRRFAVNQSGSESKSVIIPAHIESVRFTLYNSDTAASLEITDPDKNVITIDSPGVSNVSGQGTPIQVWQLDRPAAGTYTVRALNAKRPGIITWLLAYQGISATFGNPPGSFVPGKEGNIQFSLTDSAGIPVLADQDKLDINVSITQFGEEAVSQKPTLDDGEYNVSWTPKNSRPAQFAVSLIDSQVDLGLNCSLIFDFISTVTATFTPTSTSTPTPTFTPTVTVMPNPVTPVPVVAIFPQCVPQGENVRLPMRLEYGDATALPASLQWEAGSGDPGMNVSVKTINANSGEFELTIDHVNKDAGPIQLHLKGIDTAGEQASTVFEVGSPPLKVCNNLPVCDWNTELWAVWFWPLVLVLVVLIILLLVLRFGNEQNEVEVRNIFRSSDWHLLFWPLLVLLILLLLVRPMQWFCQIPPWMFLVSILIWMVLLLLLRFSGHVDPGPHRPWWLVILLLALMFIEFLIVWFPVILTLWLLLVLPATLIAIWIIIPYIPPVPDERDDLKVLEGIEEGVEKLLNDEGNILTFKQLAETNVNDIETLLHTKSWGRMMDPKTWPQQAKLADIAKRYKKIEDKQNFEAYLAWLKDGIEPDEYDVKEDQRRPAPALPWNGIPQFTPLVLNMALSPSSAYRNEPIVLSVQLNRAADEVRLETVEWKVSAKAMPGGHDVKAAVKPVSEASGTFELVLDPVQDQDAREIHVVVQALLNGRSIEIYYDKAITVQVSPVPIADDLTDLEGIGPVTARILNEKGVFTFEQLAKVDHKAINEWLNEADLKMMDAKTWPQQARLADVAKKYGGEDQRSYQAYKDWLKDGIEPDEYETDEKDRRPEALVWHGTAELTEEAYPGIFGS